MARFSFSVGTLATVRKISWGQEKRWENRVLGGQMSSTRWAGRVGQLVAGFPQGASRRVTVQSGGPG